MRRERSEYRGFTLVELLAVILILAILMAVALPLYLESIRYTERRVSRTNMRTIANANLAYHHRNPNGNFTTNLADLQPYLSTDNLSGPGTRQFEITLTGVCGGGNGGGAPIPQGSFAVQLTADQRAKYPDDGCFIPGVSTDTD